MSRRGSIRTVTTALLAAAAALAGAAPALADSATLTVTTPTGQSDPAVGVPRIFTVSGVSSLPAYVYVKSRAVGGAPCAPSYSSDSGSTLFSNKEANGAFSHQQVETWQTTGDTLFCIWIARASDAIATPIAQTVTFRAPVATVSAAVNPAAPLRGRQATVTLSGATETPSQLFAKVRAAGAPCAPTFDSDTGTTLVSYQSVNGAFSVPANVTEETAGTYVICIWLARSTSDASPLAGPQSALFTVLAPPPPPPPACVVPSVSAGGAVSAAKQRIARGHCTARVLRVYSRGIARGRVVKVAPRARTRLANGARVDLLVSRGPKPRPKLRRHRRR